MMNAIKLYISAARLVLENENYDLSVCKEINNTLIHLEQSLLCIVCRNILREPYSPTDTICQHHVCKSCLGGRKRLKPSCSWCKDYTKYVKNTQMQCLLACYKALCNYVKQSNLLNQLNLVPSSIDISRNVSSLVQKGAELLLQNREVKVKTEVCDEEDNRNYQEPYRLHLRRENSNLQNNHILENSPADCSSHEISRIRSKQDQLRVSSLGSSESMNSLDKKASDSHHSSRLRSGSDYTGNTANLDKLSDSTSEELNPKAVYSVSFTGTRSKIILKRKHVNSKKDSKKDRKFLGKESHRPEQELPSLHSIRSYSQQSQSDSLSSENSRFRKIKTKPVDTNSDRPSCRCGNATPKPGKLTCCGQRCACYMQSKACTGCRCRGCRNPHMMDGVKVLGRFAKEDSIESNLMSGNATSFQDLSVNFLNEQISQVLPVSNTSVLNNS